MRTSAAVLAALALAGAAWAGEVRYTAATLRDPFQTEVQKKVIVDSTSDNERRLRAMPIEGVVASKKDPRAIIGGKIYRIGSELLPGHAIKAIDKNGILVATTDKEILLTQKPKRKTTNETKV